MERLLRCGGWADTGAERCEQPIGLGSRSESCRATKQYEGARPILARIPLQAELSELQGGGAIIGVAFQQRFEVAPTPARIACIV